MKTVLLAIVLASSIATPAIAAQGKDLALVSHSGGTDSSGCHHDRKTGLYHCH